jgi:hypothetical protein
VNGLGEYGADVSQFSRAGGKVSLGVIESCPSPSGAEGLRHAQASHCYGRSCHCPGVKEAVVVTAFAHGWKSDLLAGAIGVEVMVVCLVLVVPAVLPCLMVQLARQLCLLQYISHLNAIAEQVITFRA